MKKIIICILLVVVMLFSFGCAQQDKSVVVASKPFTESYILAEMLTLLIEANTDITVEQKMGIAGGHTNIHPAMLEGEIDIYPEYTGTGWVDVLKKDIIFDPQELYIATKASYEEEYDIIWSELYGFQNTYTLAVKKELADSLNLKTFSDLAAISTDLHLAAEADFYERDDGYTRLAEVYGFDFGEKTGLEIGIKYEAISSDQVDVINAFSTDGRLQQAGLVVLEDDLNFFPTYYCATLIRKETLEKYPELEAVLAILDGQISNEEMTNMNYLVENEKQDPKDVAMDFLISKGLYE
jgi:osmoprotectant transport system substrate-binding protein